MTVGSHELQKYLALQGSSLADASELGASVAVQWAKSIGPIDRRLSTGFCLNDELLLNMVVI